MRVIHVSDPHLSSLANVRLGRLRGKRLLGYQSWYRKRRHQFQIETLQRISAAIRGEGPDLVVVSGDLVHIGLEREMREALSWLETLGEPHQVLLTPGNHDCYHPESWSLVQRYYQPYLGIAPIDEAPDSAADSEPAGSYPVLRRLNGLSVIAACSALPTPWWAASGTLGGAQRDRLDRMLSDERRNLRILVLHHPPLPGMAASRKALSDANALQELLRNTAPQITLHGHLHRNQALTTAHGRIFCTAPPSSVRKRAPASYRIFDIAAEPDGWQIGMTLKSLHRDEITVAEESRWFADRQTADHRSLHPRQGKDAGAQ